MKTLYSKYIIFLCTCITIALSGCTDIVTDQNIKISSNTTQGFLALSAVCKGNNIINIYYIETSFDFVRQLYTSEYNTQINVPCTYSPQYYLLKLPAGHYSITAFGDGNISHIAPAHQSINFTISRNTVVYIGRLNLQYIPPFSKHSVFNIFSTDLGGIRYSFTDNADEDLTIFANKYKGIPIGLYEKNIPINN